MSSLEEVLNLHQTNSLIYIFAKCDLCNEDWAISSQELNEKLKQLGSPNGICLRCLHRLNKKRYLQ